MSQPFKFQFNQLQNQSLKQVQRLMMSPQMQQAIHLLQMPIVELSQVVAQELEENPILGAEAELELEEEIEDHEEEVTLIKEEDELVIDESSFEILQQLDEDFRNHFSESESFQPKRSEDEEKLFAFIENSIQAPCSLYDFLMQQAHEVVSSPEDLSCAEAIIGNLDEKGFLHISLEEIALVQKIPQEKLKAVLALIQSFEPLGIAARSIPECLQIQLKNLNRESSLAYRIVADYYEELLHNRIPIIAKATKSSPKEISEAIQEISLLDLNPAGSYAPTNTRYIEPDLTIKQDQDELTIEINDEKIPPLRINGKYLKMLYDPDVPVATKEYIRQKISSGKWLMQSITQRNDTLRRIAEQLLKEQKEYLTEPTGTLRPMTMNSLSEVLELHESTIARAVSNKYLYCARGLLPLRSFFTNAYMSEQGDISSKTVKEMLLKLITEEDKTRPFSDEALSKKLKELGIPCARRTIAKYRIELKIGNTTQRRQYH